MILKTSPFFLILLFSTFSACERRNSPLDSERPHDIVYMDGQAKIHWPPTIDSSYAFSFDSLECRIIPRDSPGTARIQIFNKNAKSTTIGYYQGYDLQLRRQFFTSDLGSDNVFMSVVAYYQPVKTAVWSTTDSLGGLAEKTFVVVVDGH